MSTNYSVDWMIKLGGVTDSSGTLSWTGTQDYSSSSNVTDTNDDGDLDTNIDYWNSSGFTFSGYYIEGSGGEKWAVYTSTSYPTYAYIPFSTSNTPVGNAITLGAPGSTTLISTNLTDEVVCFLAGTSIDTSRGSVAVEDVLIGDTILGPSNGVVKFVHRMAIDKHTDLANVSRINPDPVLLKAGSLGENSPNKDLLVSPDHAFLVNNEALVEAKALVNGKSILFHETEELVDYYYHIELEDHALVSAHNTLSESYIDNVSRSMFDNYDEYMKLYPENRDMQELEYPRAKSWRQLPRHIKQALEERKNILFPEQVKEVA